MGAAVKPAVPQLTVQMIRVTDRPHDAATQNSSHRECGGKSENWKSGVKENPELKAPVFYDHGVWAWLWDLAMLPLSSESPPPPAVPCALPGPHGAVGPSYGRSTSWPSSAHTVICTVSFYPELFCLILHAGILLVPLWASCAPSPSLPCLGWWQLAGLGGLSSSDYLPKYHGP